MKTRPIVVLCPHFAPDTAPTGVVMTRIVEELVQRGHEVHVVTSLPWYRQHQVEKEWQGKGKSCEMTPWGSITRVSPFAGKDKSHIARRAIGFIGFSALLGIRGVFAGGVRRRAHAVVAMSPPLTLGLTGWLVARVRRAPLVFNIQDVFPDAAVATGKITDKRIIWLARWLERTSYRASDAVVVLSQDLQKNLEAKVSPRVAQRIYVIANFVDSENIVPRSVATPYRKEHAGNADTVVMYAGNVGFSQSIHLIIHAARALPRVMFIVNGEGSARSELEAQAAGVFNIRFVNYQDASRLSEVLASADVHVVPLKTGLGAVSVPSKAYSIMAAGRPLLAAIDGDSEVARIVEKVGCGRVVAPDQPEAFIAALSSMLQNRDEMAEMGAKGRLWVVENASPHAVGEAYHQLMATLSPTESL